VTDPEDGEPIDEVLAQAEQDALYAAVVDPQASDQVRRIISWLLDEHGPAAVVAFTEALVFDLAAAMEAIGSLEGRDTVAVIDAWFHDQEMPPEP
jgi:hypothetical protein